MCLRGKQFNKLHKVKTELSGVKQEYEKFKNFVSPEYVIDMHYVTV